MKYEALLPTLLVALTMATSHRLAGQIQGAGDHPLFSQPAPLENLHEARFGERSPALAGALSLLVFPGLGSFYAGHTSHGVRHVVIAGVTVAVMAAAALRCNKYGECGEDALQVAFVSLIGYAGNMIWATMVAVDDTEAYNREARDLAVRVAPRVVPMASGKGVGLQIVRIRW